MSRLMGFVGLAVLMGIAWALSNNRRRFPVRTVLWGLVLQFAFALVILRTGWGRAFFYGFEQAFNRLISFTDAGAQFVLGDWGVPIQATNAVTGKPHAIGFLLAFKVLPVIIFFASLMSILYHLGIMQKIVGGMAWVMKRCMRVSGAESVVAATEVFVGMTEAPFAIRPYLATLTESELLAVMVAGLATIAGSVMALYVSFGVDAGHLLCASVMSAPASLLIAKIMIPETGKPVTFGTLRIPYEKTTKNVIDAAAGGATDGLKLALNVATMLIAFIALLAMVNYLLASGHDLIARGIGWQVFPSSLEEIFGWLFRPLAWVMGVPWSESGQIGSLMGVKISLNEMIAYQKLVAVKATLSERSVTIATYALCGFANFGSMAIQIGGVSALVPELRGELSRLSLRALAGGSLATFMTACIAGILL